MPPGSCCGHSTSFLLASTWAFDKINLGMADKRLTAKKSLKSKISQIPQRSSIFLAKDLSIRFANSLLADQSQFLLSLKGMTSEPIGTSQSDAPV